MKLFLERTNAHTAPDRWKTVPKMRIFAYKINEVWSLDLAYVRVDYISGYLRAAEPLKSMYATTTADALTDDVKKGKTRKNKHI